MKAWPYCAEQIQDDAIKCRDCGEWLDGRSRVTSAPVTGYGYYGWNYEYKSEAEIFGWPLIHIAQGAGKFVSRFPILDRSNREFIHR